MLPLARAMPRYDGIIPPPGHARAVYYRTRADRLRQLAKSATDQRALEDMLALAQQYEKLAEENEKDG